MLASIVALALSGCQSERRVVRTTGGLQGLPGAEGGLEVERPRVELETDAKPGVDPSNPAGYAGPDPDDALRLTDADGTITLVCRNPRELMFHLRKTLQDEERDLVREQVLSARTHDVYKAKGLPVDEAVDFLIEHRAEVIRLLQQFPMGEMSPGMFVRPIGPSQFRLEAPMGTTDPPLKFRRFDYVYERGACRLLLIS